MKNIAVIDIGKTNAKVALVNVNSLTEIAVAKTPNVIVSTGPYSHYDIDNLWQFIIEALAELQRGHGVDAISITTHGATAALLDIAGNLALPVMDYEHDQYGSVAALYQKQRPAFAETGSPFLPAGLNLGAQIFYQQTKFPTEFANTAHIVMYPQYWAFRLTGVAANERTSLGCHTDLWSPTKADYSSLVDHCGWREKMAPLRLATEILGSITSEISRLTGIKPGTPVACGIHDSNASLVPYLLGSKKPFSVVSSGTWVICMAMGNQLPKLDETRDTLFNVNAFGEAVPTARFMGGREYEMVMGNEKPQVTTEDKNSVLDHGIFLLPSVVEGSGPFATRKSKWLGNPSATERQVATSFYLAMMTATCLNLIHAEGEIIVEGPLARNENYLDMLCAAMNRPVHTMQGASTGTTIGAALLLASDKMFDVTTMAHQANNKQRCADYAAKWLQQL